MGHMGHHFWMGHMGHGSLPLTHYEITAQQPTILKVQITYSN